LAEPAVDALCHVNVVPRCPAGAVFPRFRLDRDGLRWADRFAELARNAALLSARVSKCEWWCRVYNSYVLPAPACRNNGGMGGWKRCRSSTQRFRWCARIVDNCGHGGSLDNRTFGVRARPGTVD
jgi:hypothetical protein